MTAGQRVFAHYELELPREWSPGRWAGDQLFPVCVPGRLERVERISPTVTRWTVLGDDQIRYVLDSRNGAEVEPQEVAA